MAIWEMLKRAFKGDNKDTDIADVPENIWRDTNGRGVEDKERHALKVVGGKLADRKTRNFIRRYVTIYTGPILMMGFVPVELDRKNARMKILLAGEPIGTNQNARSDIWLRIEKEFIERILKGGKKKGYSVWARGDRVLIVGKA